MRTEVRKQVELITPFDDIEYAAKSDVLDWIDSGVEICRTVKPDTPVKHLVSYFVVIDDDHILLVDHINAELWLPTGGHVEPGEHPKITVLREAKEELHIDGEFLHEEPLFVTITETVGKTAGHTDVSLWYALRGDCDQSILFDETEFRTIRWFHKDKVPLERSDVNMARFLKKLYGSKDRPEFSRSRQARCNI